MHASVFQLTSVRFSTGCGSSTSAGDQLTYQQSCTVSASTLNIFRLDPQNVNTSIASTTIVHSTSNGVVTFGNITLAPGAQYVAMMRLSFNEGGSCFTINDDTLPQIFVGAPSVAPIVSVTFPRQCFVSGSTPLLNASIIAVITDYGGALPSQVSSVQICSITTPPNCQIHPRPQITMNLPLTSTQSFTLQFNTTVPRIGNFTSPTATFLSDPGQ